MQYGHPNGELTTGNICNFGENFQNASHSQSADQPAIKKKKHRIFLSLKLVHASKYFFVTLGSISVTEGIVNCMMQVRQMEDKMHLLFVVSEKLPHNTYEEFSIGFIYSFFHSVNLAKQKL